MRQCLLEDVLRVSSLLPAAATAGGGGSGGVKSVLSRIIPCSTIHLRHSHAEDCMAPAWTVDERLHEETERWKRGRRKDGDRSSPGR